jgi:hypothetical protein|nr:MAG TPA: desulfoferrodoxin-like protein [Caudoviricetes sp.]
MAEYIERETLLDALGFEKKLIHTVRDNSTFGIILSTPAADVAPIIRGHWIPEHHKDKVSRTEYHSYIWYHCSECGRRLIGYRDPREAPYCHCGAKMDLMEDA